MRSVFPQWRDSTMFIKYPFTDTSTLVNSSGDRLATNLIRDMRLYTYDADEGTYLSTIEIYEDTLTISFSNSAGTVIAYTELNRATPQPIAHLYHPERYTAGVLLLDETEVTSLALWTDGIHSFNARQAALVSSVITPIPNNFVAGAKTTGSDTALWPEICLVGHNGVVLREIDGKIRIDIVGNIDVNQQLKTINHIPGKNGRYTITVGTDTEDTILRLIPESPGLKIELVCQRS